MTRTQLFDMAAANGWDMVKVEAALKAYFETDAGQAAIAKAPRVVVEHVRVEFSEDEDEDGAQREGRITALLEGKGSVGARFVPVGPAEVWTPDYVRDLLEEVAAEKRRVWV